MPTGQLNTVIQHLRAAISAPDEAGLSDGQLLERFVCRRDSAAIEALVRRHGPMVWGVCRRVLHHHHDAEDAFQATFLVLARKAASIHPRAQVGNWLYGVAHQTALKARATTARRRTRERQQPEMPETAMRERDFWPDLQPILDRELTSLPDRYRAVIVLCDLEGKTRIEAARVLGCPEGTINSRLTRARTILAKRLSRCGLAVSGGALAMVVANESASASVPVSIMTSTIKTVSLAASGQSFAVGLISPQVNALMEGVMKAMLISKLKTITAIAFLIVAIGSVGGIYSRQSATAQEAQPPAGASPEKGPGERTDRKVRQSASSDGFAGSWETTYGPMTLSKDGDKVKGSYEMGEQHCTIEGKVAKRRFTFTYQEPNAQGEGWFELSNDGASFEGKWRENGQEQWSDWTGTRSTAGFVGTWETTYGPMTLSQKGDKITGSYDMGGQKCSVEGKIEGRRLTFTYQEPNAQGAGWFELASDGQSFAGEWRAEGSDQWSEWKGSRTKVEISFAGTWNTTYGPMTLTQNGNKVTGTYEMNGQRCLIIGIIQNDRLEIVYGEPDAFGEGFFELSKDGMSFAGKWHVSGASEMNDWTGERTGS
jgi:RNA polymerase sigma factor (sigma-70 family)